MYQFWYRTPRTMYATKYWNTNFVTDFRAKFAISLNKLHDLDF